ncbi:MAG: prepilin-type N-terminal cleavage/methylation domain-containing protein [Myxococcales bacterium]|nr:prepilin-type N-terminal cleavage/methylation domain-containing protein [Myxococcales bacterium]
MVYLANPQQTLERHKQAPSSSILRKTIPDGDKSTKRGFTLLEVMVAVSMLALSITAMAAINANSFGASNYARGVTVATLLGRGKMLDLEIILQKDGFGNNEKTFKGDFKKEGFPSVSWEAVARPVDIDISPLIESFFGGELSSDALPNEMKAFVGALNGESFSADGLIDDKFQKEVQGGELATMLGGQQMEVMLKQISKTLTESIREISLEITWGKGYDQESIKFVQYLTTTGRLSNITIPASEISTSSTSNSSNSNSRDTGRSGNNNNN